MRKPNAAALAPTRTSPAKIALPETPAYWVCLALMLALVLLGGRIVSIL